MQGDDLVDSGTGRLIAAMGTQITTAFSITYASGVPTLDAGTNVESITDDGAGTVTILFERDYKDINYVVLAICGFDTGGNTTPRILEPRLVGSVTLRSFNTAGTATDPFTITGAIIGELVE